MTCCVCHLEMLTVFNTLIALGGDTVTVGNMHTSCLRSLVGSKRFDRLFSAIRAGGWRQLELPELESAE